MTAMIDPMSKPVDMTLSDIPEKFVIGDRIDWAAVQAALNINTSETLSEALLFLYLSDWKINYYVNESLIRLAVPALDGKYELPPAPKTLDEAPWLAADIYCEGCPGSEYIDYGGGFAAPRCSNIGRVERYTDCQQYRTVIAESTLTAEESEKLYADALVQLKENLNVEKTQSETEPSGHVHSDERSDRNPATDIVKSIVGGDSRSSSEAKAD